jgi:hypothetical protein
MRITVRSAWSCSDITGREIRDDPNGRPARGL